MHGLAFTAQNIGCPDLQSIKLSTTCLSKETLLTMASDLVGIFVADIATGLVNFCRNVTRKARTRRFSRGSLLIMRLMLIKTGRQKAHETGAPDHAHIDARSSH